MYMYSDSTGAGDLAHATGSIDMDRTIDGWIHNITSDGFAVNQIVFRAAPSSARSMTRSSRTPPSARRHRRPG